MSMRPQLVVPLVTDTEPLRAQAVRARDAGADMLELRVDLVGDAQAVADFLAGPRDLPVIVTVRRAEEGGGWRGTEAERLALLARLAALRPDYLDVEFAAWGTFVAARPEYAPPRSGPPRVIVSQHDLHGTPADVAELVKRLAATGADVVKLACTAADATDSLRVAALLPGRAPGAPPLVALAMGEAGLAARVLAAKLGGFLTFASLAPEAASAPGQPTISDLRGLYRWDVLTPATAVYGVVGWPVAHSLGPHIHNAALRAAEIDGVYLPLPVRPDFAAFAAFMQVHRDAPELEVSGLSVTLPHKEHALRWLAAHGGRWTIGAAACGAVNTLTRDAGGRWHGDNTDIAGIRAALATHPPLAGDGLRGRRVLVLGAGGAARAAVVAVQGAGAEVALCNRTAARAEAAAQDLRCATRPWAARTALTDADILINCTSVGLWPAVDESPLPDAALAPPLVVLDTIYRPARTRLLRAATAAGCVALGGTELFIGQAAAQFATWHGAQGTTVAAMRAALPAG